MKISLQIGKLDPQQGVRCVQGGIAIGKLGCAVERLRKLAGSPGARVGVGSWLGEAAMEAQRMRRMFPKAFAQARAVEDGFRRLKEEFDYKFRIAESDGPRILKALDGLESNLRALAKEGMGRCGRRMPEDADAERLVREGKGPERKPRSRAEPQAPPMDLPAEARP